MPQRQTLKFQPNEEQQKAKIHVDSCRTKFTKKLLWRKATHKLKQHYECCKYLATQSYSQASRLEHRLYKVSMDTLKNISYVRLFLSCDQEMMKKDYSVLLFQLDRKTASDVSTRCSGRLQKIETTYSRLINL